MRPALQRGLPLKLSQLSGITVLQSSFSQGTPSNRTSYIGIATSFQKDSVLTSASASLAEASSPSKRRKMGAVEGPLAGLEPANVWGFFHDITKIPRPSKHEEKCAPSQPSHNVCMLKFPTIYTIYQQAELPAVRVQMQCNMRRQSVRGIVWSIYDYMRMCILNIMILQGAEMAQELC